ncbi:transcriptional repressor [Gluconobacter sphaericus]|nr:transcriptional repressor [Gluconobacter sphaericus]
MKERVMPPSEGASQVCGTRKDHTTSLRNNVLDALTEADVPLSAYDILRCVSHPDCGRIAPTTIYRALGKLIASGLVGRLESRNAFVRIRASDPSRLVYCICDQCGAAQAVENTLSCQFIDAAAETLGFQIRHRVIEIQGVCARCSVCPSFLPTQQKHKLPTRAPK